MTKEATRFKESMRERIAFGIRFSILILAAILLFPQFVFANSAQNPSFEDVPDLVGWSSYGSNHTIEVVEGGTNGHPSAIDGNKLVRFETTDSGSQSALYQAARMNIPEQDQNKPVHLQFSAYIGNAGNGSYRVVSVPLFYVGNNTNVHDEALTVILAPDTNSWMHYDRYYYPSQPVARMDLYVSSYGNTSTYYDSFNLEMVSNFQTYEFSTEQATLTLSSLGDVSSLQDSHQTSLLRSAGPLASIKLQNGSEFTSDEIVQLEPISDHLYQVGFRNSDITIILEIKNPVSPTRNEFVEFKIAQVNNPSNLLIEDINFLILSPVLAAQNNWQSSQILAAPSDSVFLNTLPVNVKTICGDIGSPGAVGGIRYICRASRWMIEDGSNNFTDFSGALIAMQKSDYNEALERFVAAHPSLPQVHLNDGRWHRSSDQLHESYLFAVLKWNSNANDCGAAESLRPHSCCDPNQNAQTDPDNSTCPIINFAREGNFKQLLLLSALNMGNYNTPTFFSNMTDFYNATQRFRDAGINVGIHTFLNQAKMCFGNQVPGVNCDDAINYRNPQFPLHEMAYSLPIGTLTQDLSAEAASIRVNVDVDGDGNGDGDTNLHNNVYFSFYYEGNSLYSAGWGQEFIINNELVQCKSFSGNTLDCTNGRGFYGTTAASHSQGDTIYFTPHDQWAALHFNHNTETGRNLLNASISNLAQTVSALDSNLLYFDGSPFVLVHPGITNYETMRSRGYMMSVHKYLSGLTRIPLIQAADNISPFFTYTSNRVASDDGVAFKKKDSFRTWKVPSLIWNNSNPFALYKSETGWDKFHGAILGNGIYDFDATTADDTHYSMLKTLAFDTSMGLEIEDHQFVDSHKKIHNLFQLTGTYHDLINQELAGQITIPAEIKNYFRGLWKEGELNHISNFNLVEKKFFRFYATPSQNQLTIQNPFGSQKLKFEIRPRFTYKPDFADPDHTLISNFNNIPENNILRSTSDTNFTCTVDSSGNVNITNATNRRQGCGFKIPINGVLNLTHKRGVGLKLQGGGNNPAHPELITVELSDGTWVRDYQLWAHAPIANGTIKVLGDPNGEDRDYEPSATSDGIITVDETINQWHMAGRYRNWIMNFATVNTVRVYIDNIQPGQSSQFQLQELKALAENGESELQNPSLTIQNANGTTVLSFPVTLKINETDAHILEFDGYRMTTNDQVGSYRLFTSNYGDLQIENHMESPLLPTGNSTVTFQSSNGANADIQISIYDDADNDGIADDNVFGGSFNPSICNGSNHFCRDNCPSVPNSDQTDSDNDGVGNACDQPDNHAPVANPDSFNVIQNSVNNTLDVLANDSDDDTGDFLRIISINPLPRHGSATIVNAGQAIQYTPDIPYAGADNFSYTIEDSHQATATAQVTVQVLSDPNSDSDQDGMPDAWENQYGCINYLVADSNLDSDSDLLTNLGEYQNLTNPCDADSDHDGYDDGREISGGSDPNDPNSTPPNQAPNWNSSLPGIFDLTEEMPFNLTLPFATDPDAGDMVSYELLGKPPFATFDSTTHSFNWTPSYGSHNQTQDGIGPTDGRIHFIARDQHNAERTLTISFRIENRDRTIPQAIQSVPVILNGQIIIQNEPFIPIMAGGIPLIENGVNMVERVRNLGFNSISTGAFGREIDQAAYCQGAQRAGCISSAVYAIQNIMNEVHRLNAESGARQMKVLIMAHQPEIVQVFQNDPNLLGWELPDEPDLGYLGRNDSYYSPANLQIMANQIRSQYGSDESAHPIFVNLSARFAELLRPSDQANAQTSDIYQHYIDLTDAVSFDYYFENSNLNPQTPNNHRADKLLQGFAEELRELAHDKPVFYYLEATNYGTLNPNDCPNGPLCVTGPSENHIYPITPEIVRDQLRAAFEAGVAGIRYYGSNYYNDQNHFFELHSSLEQAFPTIHDELHNGIVQVTANSNPVSFPATVTLNAELNSGFSAAEFVWETSADLAGVAGHKVVCSATNSPSICSGSTLEINVPTPGVYQVKISASDTNNKTAVKFVNFVFGDADSDGDGLLDSWEMQYFSTLNYGANDDPDHDWRTNIREFQDSTDPANPEGNLVQNPSFENDVDANGIPIHWIDLFNAGTKTIDAQVKHFGGKSWKWTQTQTDQDHGAYSDFIPVDPDKLYRLAAFLKSETGSEEFTLGWEEFDENQQNACPENIWNCIHSFVGSHTQPPSSWTFFDGIMKPSNPLTRFVKIRLFMFSNTANRSLWWDDFSLIEIDSQYLEAFGCQNDANSRCLDFGDGDLSIPNIQFNDGAMSAPGSEGDVTFRNLNALQTLQVDFDSFEVDTNGLPLHPMILEVAFKDTVDDSVYAQNEYTTGHRVFVKSKIDYQNLDQRYINHGFPQNREQLVLGLAGKNDGTWKYQHFGFEKNAFQLIRSIQGKFTFKVQMPNLGPLDQDPGFALPIDYISLKVISEEELELLRSRERSFLNFEEVNRPNDTPNPPVSYPDPELVVFTRDLMKPIYHDTKPLLTELVDTLTAQTAQNEITALSFGVYTDLGIDNLTFLPSDLVNQNTNSIIPASQIKLYEVIERAARTQRQAEIFTDYSMMPDHLQEVSSLNVARGQSKRVWIKAHISNDAVAGLYTGTVNILQDGTARETITLSIQVLPIRLELPANGNPVYHDPYLKIFSENLDEVYRVYRETGFDPFLYPTIAPYVNGNQEVTHFDTEAFQNRIAEMTSAGFLKKKAIINLYALTSHVARVTGQENVPIYERFSNINFRNGFRLGIQTYLELAAQHELEFYFDLGDEPCSNPTGRIMVDRLAPLVHEAGGFTTATYWISCDSDFLIDPSYQVPGDVLGPATSLIDYKVWGQNHQDEGYERHNNPSNPNYYGAPDRFGYYTTVTSYLRNPIYNRFIHGFLATKTNAALISAYAMGDFNGDPFNDFDLRPNNRRMSYDAPDFLFAYPSWNNGKLLETMALEGIRLGIQDAKYVATLKRLIEENPDHPSAPVASNFLNLVSSRINPHFWADYIASNRPEGYTAPILSNLDANQDPNNYQAFSMIQNQVVALISSFLNQPPQVNAGSDQTMTLPDSVALSGTVSDDRLPIPANLTVTWSKVSGPGNVQFTDTDNPTATATFSEAGTYVLRLTANDGEQDGFDEVQIIVNPAPANQLPIANAGTDQIIEIPFDQTNTNINLDGSLSYDPDGTISLYEWTGTSVDPADEMQPLVNLEVGQHIFNLRVRDNSGEWSSTSDVVSITIQQAENANQPPQVNAGSDLTITLPDSAQLSGSVTDDGLPIPVNLTASWSQVGGPGSAEFSNADDLTSTVSFSEAGLYTLRLSATDGERTSYDEVEITVNAPPPPANEAPQIDAGNNQTVSEGSVVQLSGTATDPDGNLPLTFAWTQISGPVANLSDTHILNPTFLAPQVGLEGAAVVLRLEVRDHLDSASTDEVSIIITDEDGDAPPPPDDGGDNNFSGDGNGDGNTNAPIYGTGGLIVVNNSPADGASAQSSTGISNEPLATPLAEVAGGASNTTGVQMNYSKADESTLTFESQPTTPVPNFRRLNKKIPAVEKTVSPKELPKSLLKPKQIFTQKSPETPVIGLDLVKKMGPIYVYKAAFMNANGSDLSVVKWKFEGLPALQSISVPGSGYLVYVDLPFKKNLPKRIYAKATAIGPNKSKVSQYAELSMTSVPETSKNKA